jgi:hypothetical protein
MVNNKGTANMIKQIKAFAGEYRIAGLKSFRGMEGTGWEGQLFRGDTFIGFVGDDSTGGPVRIECINNIEYQALVKHAASKITDAYERTEMFLDHLANYQFSVKRLQNACKKQVIISAPEAKIQLDGNGVPISYVPLHLKSELTPQLREKIVAKYHDREIWNEDILSFTVPRALSKPKLK